MREDILYSGSLLMTVRFTEFEEETFLPHPHPPENLPLRTYLHWLLKEIEQGHQLDFSLLSQTAHCPKSQDLSASITKRIQLRTSPDLPSLDPEGDFRACLRSRCCAWLLPPVSFPEEYQTLPGVRNTCPKVIILY